MGGKTNTVIIIVVALVALLLLLNVSSSWNMTTLRQQASITLPYDIWNSGAGWRQVFVKPDGSYNGTGYDYLTIPFASPVYMTIVNNLVVTDPTPDNNWWYGLGWMENNTNSFAIEYNAPPHVVRIWAGSSFGAIDYNYTTELVIQVATNGTITMATDKGETWTGVTNFVHINRMNLAPAGGCKSGAVTITYDIKPYGTTQGGNSTQSLWDKFIKWITGAGS